MRSPRALVLAFALAVLGAEPASASDRSELLVAQGEVAYHAGGLEEARARFTDALAADPGDETARAWLDVLAASIPREPARGERPEAAAKRWDLEVGTGVEYDSNVRLDPTNRQEDAAFLFTLAGHVDPWRDDRTLVRLDYDFFEVLHTRVTDFDFRSNRFRGTFARAVLPGLWLGVQGGYDHGTLHTHAYLQEGWVMPYLSIVEGDRGSTQLVYRHGDQDYLGSPFGTASVDRDGTLDGTGVTQLLFFFDRRLAVTLAFAYEEATPYKASGDDYARHSYQGSAGVRFPAWWRTLVEIDYVYRADDYTKPNSYAESPSERRSDSGHYVAAFVRRPIIPHLDALVSYYATVNGSNISLFEYDRNVVALELRYAF